MSSTPGARNLQDHTLEVVTAWPAAAANVTSEAIDLEQTIGGQVESVEFELEIEATTTLVDTKVATFKVYDSANNSSFAAIDPLISTTVTGAAGPVSAAKTVRFRLPSSARRYIAVNCAVESGGGNSTAKNFTLRLLA
jgi:hypothetical protein